MLPVSNESLLLRHLKAGKFEDIELLIHEALKKDSSGRSKLNTYEGELLFRELTAIIIKFSQEERKHNIAFKIPEYEDIHTFQQMINLFKDICNQKKKAYEQNIIEKNSKYLKNAIIDYVNSNYLDRNMCHKMVKDKFDISFSYISRVFNDAMDYSFLEYLNRKRINHAKKLLSNPATTILKAGEQSGYNDISTFIKCFKKYEGITPGEYQRRFLKEKQGCI